MAPLLPRSDQSISADQLRWGELCNCVHYHLVEMLSDLPQLFCDILTIVAYYTNQPKQCKNAKVRWTMTHNHGQINYLDLDHGQSWSKIAVWSSILKVNPQMTRLVGKRWNIRSGEIIMQQKGRRAVAAQMILYIQKVSWQQSRMQLHLPLLLLCIAGSPAHCRFSFALQVIRWEEDWHQVQSLTHLHRSGSLPCLSHLKG